MSVTSHGRQWRINCGRQHAVVAQRGGALRRYQVGDHQVVDDVGDFEVASGYHGAVLAPWPNRITAGRWVHNGVSHETPITEPATNSALHGLLAWAPWQLLRQTSSSVQLGISILAQPGYPFSVDVAVTWSLTDDGLTCELSAYNAGVQDAPFGIATHPYFTVGDDRVDDLTLTVPAATWQRTDADLHPVELLPVHGTTDYRSGRPLRGAALDTAFTDLAPGAEGSTVVLQGTRRQLRIWADSSFKWWQVYTSDDFSRQDPSYRKAIAIEAMTCGPDAFNSGTDLITLQPGNTWTGTWGARLD